MSFIIDVFDERQSERMTVSVMYARHTHFIRKQLLNDEVSEGVERDHQVNLQVIVVFTSRIQDGSSHDSLTPLQKDQLLERDVLCNMKSYFVM